MSDKVIPSYGKVWSVGHREVRNLFDAGPVYVQEKIDGSQFSFMVGEDGVLHFRSKGAVIYPPGDSLFAASVAHVVSVADRLKPGWVYRGEAMRAPKHNTLAYGRVPKGHIVLFDVEIGLGYNLTAPMLEEAARDLGMEPVRTFCTTTVASMDQVMEFLQEESQLGGTTVEGVVFKPVDPVYGTDGKRLAAKFVSEAFKEKNHKEWKASKPQRADVIEMIANSLRTEARWRKTVQRLRDDGKLEGSPRDIGPLIKSLKDDVAVEESDYIRDKLFEWAHKDIIRKATAGFPEWYKEQLLAEQFGD